MAYTGGRWRVEYFLGDYTGGWMVESLGNIEKMFGIYWWVEGIDEGEYRVWVEGAGWNTLLGIYGWMGGRITCGDI